MKLKHVKVKEGQQRNALWAKLSASEKLASLDRRLGKGLGAARQRKLLSK